MRHNGMMMINMRMITPPAITTGKNQSSEVISVSGIGNAWTTTSSSSSESE